MTQTLLDRNLLALATRDPVLGARITRAEEGSSASFARAKSGRTIPVVRTPDGDRPLYSTVNPEREVSRMVESYPRGGYFVILGFGNGSHVAPFLDRDETDRVLVVDKDVALLKAVFTRFDLRRILLDPRVLILVDPEPGELERTLTSTYFPALGGDLSTVHLRSRIDTEPAFFQDCIESLKTAIDLISDDYTVQTRFGKKWFLNTVANLEDAGRSTTVLERKRRVVVTAAGPSLELQIPQIRRERSEGLLIATDTSLPALLSQDLVPDLVISIDCQHISYNHFLGGFPPDVPLVLDLASPKIVTRLTRRLCFFSNGHPFSQYVTNHWRRFPSIDTSGGNVAHAAVSLADRLGAHEIRLYGADFSYPFGKSYARGTYIYPYFHARDQRLAPVENQFFGFLLRNSVIEKTWRNGTIRYVTRPMATYKERLENLARDLDADLKPAAGLGADIRVPPKRMTPTREFSLFGAGPASGSATEFLKSYLRGLRGLPPPQTPLSTYMDSLRPVERNLWMTLYPAAAVLRRAASGEDRQAVDIIRDSRSWTIGALERVVG